MLTALGEAGEAERGGRGERDLYVWYPYVGGERAASRFPAITRHIATAGSLTRPAGMRIGLSTVLTGLEEKRQVRKERAMFRFGFNFHHSSGLERTAPHPHKVQLP